MANYLKPYATHKHRRFTKSEEGDAKMFFPAHINKDGTVQTVGQHCKNTAELAKMDLCKLGLADTAYLAGLLHDAGKCTDKFRNYIEKASRGENV